jgi:hypothetical protein
MRMELLWTILLLFTLSTSSCEAQGQPEEFINVLAGRDQQGPIFMGGKAIDENRATYYFDKLIYGDEKDFKVVDSNNEIIRVHPYEEGVTLTFKNKLPPGKRIDIVGRVRDSSGNTLSFRSGVWGYNPHVPHLLINEFTTKGSGNNPDRIELLALTEGDLAGVALFDGVNSDWESEVIFPPYQVKAGDYIVVQYGQELSGKHPIEFYGGEVGLGSNNGVITLYNAPNGELIDAVIYSNRTSESDANYGGFGTSKVFKRVEALSKSEQWLPHPITPEGAVDSTYSTATRSFCRNNALDTNTKGDWYICNTGKASFGEANSQEVYTP